MTATQLSLLPSEVDTYPWSPAQYERYVARERWIAAGQVDMEEGTPEAAALLREAYETWRALIVRQNGGGR